MADVNGSNYQKQFVAIPSDVADIGEYGGRVKTMFDNFSGAVAADKVLYGKIPAGARILRLTASGAGTAPNFLKRDSQGVETAIAEGDKLAESSDLVCELDGDTSASGFIFAEYLLD